MEWTIKKVNESKKEGERNMKPKKKNGIEPT